MLNIKIQPHIPVFCILWLAALIPMGILQGEVKAHGPSVKYGGHSKCTKAHSNPSNTHQPRNCENIPHLNTLHTATKLTVAL